MKVTILCGIPGSGKSTYTRKNHPGAFVVSADNFPGLYETLETFPVQLKFNPSLLPAAHGKCLRDFVDVIEDREASILGVSSIVVDNTNTTVAEIAPYAALALAYGHDLEIVTLDCFPEDGARRNTHGVPLAACIAMHKRLADRQLPPWWNHRTV